MFLSSDLQALRGEGRTPCRGVSEQRVPGGGGRAFARRTSRPAGAAGARERRGGEARPRGLPRDHLLLQELQEGRRQGRAGGAARGQAEERPPSRPEVGFLELPRQEGPPWRRRAWPRPAGEERMN